MFESKLGEWIQIEHINDQLNDSVYGSPVKYYKSK